MADSNQPTSFTWQRTFDIPGVKNDASGIAWSPVTGNLFVVVDGPEKVVEITTHSELVRKVKDCSGVFGDIAGPDDCYLALRGLRSMGVRLRHHAQSALQVATWSRIGAIDLQGPHHSAQ